MNSRLMAVALIISCGLLAFIIELVRRRKLMEKYSLLWILMAVTLLALILWPRLGISISKLLGIISVSNTVFLAAMCFVVLLCIHFSVRISSLSEQIRVIAQEIVLLKNDVERLSGGAKPGARGALDEDPTS